MQTLGNIQRYKILKEKRNREDIQPSWKSLCQVIAVKRTGGKWQLGNTADLSQELVEALWTDGCLADKDPSGALAEVMNTVKLRLISQILDLCCL